MENEVYKNKIKQNKIYVSYKALVKSIIHLEY